MKPQRSGHTMGWVKALAIAGGASFVALCGWVLADGYRETRARGLAGSANIAVLVEHDVARMFELFDLSLKGVTEGLQRPDIWSLAPDVRKSILFDNASNAAFLSSILVVDEGGEVVIDSRSESQPHTNLADRDYFIAHRENADLGLFVGQPIVSRAGARGWVLPISRRIERADGGFGGVVRASLSLDYFTAMLQNLDLGPHGEATIFKTDGVVVMRQPFRLFNIGKDASGFDLFKHLQRARTGQFAGVSRTDGTERLYTYRQVRNRPLVVAVGAGAADVFAAWRGHAVLLALAMSGLLAGGGALFVLLRRELRRREEAEASLADTARQLAVFAYRDGLTGLANRRHFDERLAEEVARTQRSGEPLSLLLIDVDYFKKYNDNRGHLAGDEALRRIGASIQSVLNRPADLAARFGGEEITVLLPGTGLDGAKHLAERIRSAIAELDIRHPLGLEGRLTVSIGAAVADDEGIAADLIARADEALYRSKGQGRNRVEHCTSTAGIAA